MINYFLKLGCAALIGSLQFCQAVAVEPTFIVGEKLYQTDCKYFNEKRLQALNTLQEYGDSCTDVRFKQYLAADEKTSIEMEAKYPILLFYKQACDKIIAEVKTMQVPQGHVYIWSLYNMGYVVKTPSTCFGIDINHKYAAKFAPLIDFLCITHQHNDHYDTGLNNLLFQTGKPVLSNFFPLDSDFSYPYTYRSSTPRQYVINGIQITTNINDHNSTLRNFIVTYQFNCGAETNHTILMHVGDSSFNPKQYSITSPIDILIPRYAPTIDYKIIGPVIQPKVILMSHIMELRHVNMPGSRSSIAQGLEHIATYKSLDAYLPFWGERFDYKK